MIFQEGAVAELMEKLSLLMNNRETRQSLAEKARERVLKNYTQKKIAQETFQVYQSMLLN